MTTSFEQRHAALRLANAVRSSRAAFRLHVERWTPRRHGFQFCAWLVESDPLPEWSRTWKVLTFLKIVPGVGRARILDLRRELWFLAKPNLTLEDMTAVQREELANALRRSLPSARAFDPDTADRGMYEALVQDCTGIYERNSR